MVGLEWLAGCRVERSTPVDGDKLVSGAKTGGTIPHGGPKGQEASSEASPAARDSWRGVVRVHVQGGGQHDEQELM